MLSTRWTQVKIGPLLRRERDPQFYYNLFTRRASEIAGWSRLWLLLAAERVDEPEDFGVPHPQRPARQPVLVTFSGQRDYFGRLNGWSEFLDGELRAITRERWRREAAAFGDMPIGVHVRVGDFPTPPPRASAAELLDGKYRTPLSWFIRCLEVIRAELGFAARAFVVSDGRDDQLADLLAVDGVFRANEGSAISGILMLAQAKILLASGGSAYGGWASFLGQMPTIVRPGHFWHWFRLENRRGQYAGECDPTAPPPRFLEQVRAVGHLLRGARVSTP